MRAIVLFAAALLSACMPQRSGDTAPGVSLVVEPTAVSAGDSITLVLSNRSSDSIGYNLCASGLERLSGEAWQPIPSSRVCTMELRTLSPGAQTRYTVELSADLAPGEYRSHTTIEILGTGARTGVRSGPFRIVATG